MARQKSKPGASFRKLLREVVNREANIGWVPVAVVLARGVGGDQVEGKLMVLVDQDDWVRELLKHFLETSDEQLDTDTGAQRPGDDPGSRGELSQPAD